MSRFRYRSRQEAEDAAERWERKAQALSLVLNAQTQGHFGGLETVGPYTARLYGMTDLHGGLVALTYQPPGGKSSTVVEFLLDWLLSATGGDLQIAELAAKVAAWKNRLAK